MLAISGWPKAFDENIQPQTQQHLEP
jgi:hypothetical protein